MAGSSLDLFLEPHLEDWDLHRFMWRESIVEHPPPLVQRHDAMIYHEFLYSKGL